MKNIKEYLTEIAEKDPNSIINKLAKGSKIQKSWSLYYEIDDINAHKKLESFPEGIIPYRIIHRALESSQSKIRELFADAKTIPFSKVLETNVGECLEKAILMKLSTQKTHESFLINGVIEIEKEPGAAPHAYNIIFINGRPFLIDVENPWSKENSGKTIHPYIAPIKNIGKKYCEIEVQKEWKQGRNYCIF